MFNVTDVIMFVLGGAVLGLGVSQAIQWYRSWRGTLGNKELFVECTIAALADLAEKLYLEQGRGKEKLAWVLGGLLAVCEQKGITFDVEKMTEQINTYVKQVINAAKEGLVLENSKD